MGNCFKGDCLDIISPINPQPQIDIEVSILENNQPSVCDEGPIRYPKQSIKLKVVYVGNSWQNEVKQPGSSYPISKMVGMDGGLANIGNTCYLNSALQCLYHTEPLNVLLSSVSKGEFIKQYKKILGQLFSSSKAVNPAKLKILIQDYNGQFRGFKQNDSGELLNTVLNMIHEETNIVENPIKMKMVEDEEEMDECLYEKFVRRDKDRAHSIIDDIFTGRFKTVYECNGCPKQKRLFEKFSIIYLPIPGGMNVSIDDCLREFERPDHLKEWDCKICKAETPHTKKTTIYRANKILIFCLKRFKSNNQKIQKSINIPFQLSLDGFRAKEQSETLQDSQPQYQLYGAINHFGSFDGGHYTAYCYNSKLNHWKEFNDSFVQELKEGQMQDKVKRAYLLFYKLKQGSKILTTG